MQNTLGNLPVTVQRLSIQPFQEQISKNSILKKRMGGREGREKRVKQGVDRREE